MFGRQWRGYHSHIRPRHTILYTLSKGGVMRVGQQHCGVLTPWRASPDRMKYPLHPPPYCRASTVDLGMGGLELDPLASVAFDVHFLLQSQSSSLIPVYLPSIARPTCDAV